MKVGQDHADFRHDGQHGQLVRDRHPVEMIPRGPEALPKEWSGIKISRNDLAEPDELLHRQL